MNNVSQVEDTGSCGFVLNITYECMIAECRLRYICGASAEHLVQLGYITCEAVAHLREQMAPPASCRQRRL